MASRTSQRCSTGHRVPRDGTTQGYNHHPSPIARRKSKGCVLGELAHCTTRGGSQAVYIRHGRRKGEETRVAVPSLINGTSEYH